MDKVIPVVCPKASFDKYRDIINSRIDKVLNSGWYILGEEVKIFEERFANYCNTNYCVGVSNGTEALALALKAVGVCSGDEVITVSHTSVATVAAIEMIGAIPVFVDIEEYTFTIDPNKIESVVSPKTKAIIPVHLYGQPCKIEAVCAIASRLNLKVVEDCCQAHGASYNGRRVGSFGDAGAFSFYPTKNLGALGDAGAVVTKNQEVFKQLISLRQYGWQEKQNSLFPGWNSRMDEIQAAVLNAKLTYLSEDNGKRRNIVYKYSKFLDPKKLLPQKVDILSEPVWHLCVVRDICNSRSKLIDFLKSCNIGVAIHYPIPVHLQSGYLNRIKGSDNLVNTEKICNQILTLPLYPEMSDDKINCICEALNSWSKLPVLSWSAIKQKKDIHLYIGTVPLLPEYDNLIGLTLEESSCTSIHHDITDPIPLPDNSVDSIQSEDVFEHICFNPKLIAVMDEIYRVLRPGGLFRLSLPDYGCDIYQNRSVKNENGDVVFDPVGGVNADGTRGHKWFPRFDCVDYLIQKSLFSDSKIEYLQYYKMDGTPVIKAIDYSKGMVTRTPDFDERVQNPKRPLSLVVDIIKK